MNYQEHYTKLIKRSIVRNWTKKTATTYVERHHVIPKSLGGTDEKSNLVYLTAKEHFVAHLLLAKIYGGSLIYAAWAMAKQANKDQNRSYKVSASTYEKLKTQNSGIVSARMKLANTGRIQTDLHKKNKKESIQKFYETEEGKKEAIKVSERMKKANPNKGGVQHPNADHNIYEFQNLLTNERFTGKRMEFKEKFDMTNNQIDGLAQGRKTRNGWIIQLFRKSM